ncbi:MAG: YggT family protein [Clostridia bacterium]|nr:YggT family protein [Clostridia bacterium]
MGVMLSIAIGILSEIISWAIIIRALISWLPISQDSFIIRALDVITEPVVSPVRNLMGRLIKTPMMMDFSPVIAMILVDVIGGALQSFCLNLFI